MMRGWTFDNKTGQIRNADGWALASVPFHIGDESDLENGRLMAAAPELVDALSICRDLLGALRFYVPEEHLPLVNAIIVNAAMTMSGGKGWEITSEMGSWNEKQARESLEKVAKLFYGGTK